MTSNKLSPFQRISSEGKFETIAQSIHSGGTRAHWTGTQATHTLHEYLQDIQMFFVTFKREFVLFPVYMYLNLTVYENYTNIFG